MRSEKIPENYPTDLMLVTDCTKIKCCYIQPPRGVIDQGWLCPLVGESGVKHKRSITNNQGPLNSAAAAVSPIQGKEMNNKSNLHYF